MKKIFCFALVIMLILPCFGSLTFADGTVSNEHTPVMHINAADNLSATDSNGNLISTVPDNSTDGTTYQAYNTVSGGKVACRAINVVKEEDGFALSADGNIDFSVISSYYSGMVFSSVAELENVSMRVDSVRFKMPEQGDSEGFAYLFSYDNYYAYSSYSFRNSCLKITDGNAYVVDMTKGSIEHINCITTENIKADKWYRAERILDTRIDNDYTAENWQRYIIFDDTTNEVVGDSGWVMTGTELKDAEGTDRAENQFIYYPFAGMGFGAWRYTTGSKMYIDDIKSYAVYSPLTEYSIGGVTQNNCLKFPYKSSAKANLVYFGIGYSLYPEQYTSVRKNGVLFTAKNVVYKNPKVYFETDFLLPKLNKRDMALLDLGNKVNIPQDKTFKPTGTVYISTGGVLTVREWNPDEYRVAADGETLFATPGVYDREVKLSDGSDFSLQLEPEKWYKARLSITYPTITSVTDENADTLSRAVVTITDESGNTYTTEEFNFKSPKECLGTTAGTYDRITLVQGYKSSALTNITITGMDIWFDNVKFVMSTGEMDDKNAFWAIDESFDGWDVGTTFYNVFNQYASKPIGRFTNSYAAVGNNLYSGNEVPQTAKSISITLGEPINSNMLKNSVNLYDGDVDVSDLISGAVYDSDNKSLNISFKALSPGKKYNVKLLREAATDEGNIFSVLSGECGAVVEYPFCTEELESDALILTSQLSSNGETLSGALTGGQSVSADGTTLKNPNTHEISYVAIAAAYSENGKIEDLIIDSGELTAGEEKELSFGGQTLLKQSNGGRVKIIVWDNLGCMTALCDEYVYPMVE